MLSLALHAAVLDKFAAVACLQLDVITTFDSAGRTHFVVGWFVCAAHFYNIMRKMAHQPTAD